MNPFGLPFVLFILKWSAGKSFKLRQLYYKLRQCVVTNYGSFIKLLQITAAFGVITNYSDTFLQIKAGITNYDVIRNYIVTEMRNTFQKHTLRCVFLICVLQIQLKTI